MSLIYVHAGELIVVNRPTILTSVLGSCVSVCAWDKSSGVAGMNHFMLPRSGEGLSTPYYGDVAVPKLLDRMIATGAVASQIQAIVVGAGHHPELSHEVPMQNLHLAQELLSLRRVNVLNYDVGGDRSRKVTFDTGSGTVSITKGGECSVINIARY